MSVDFDYILENQMSCLPSLLRGSTYKNTLEKYNKNTQTEKGNRNKKKEEEEDEAVGGQPFPTGNPKAEDLCAGDCDSAGE